MSGITSVVIEKAALTGVAANAIGGQMIHALFRLPIGNAGDLLALAVSEVMNIRNKLRDIEYFVIDEKSMISCCMLNYIDRCMREIFERADLYFGGRNMILIGDFF